MTPVFLWIIIGWIWNGTQKEGCCIKYRLPFAVVCSCIIDTLLSLFVAGAVGFLFLLFGLIANFLIMTIIGAVVLVWYLLWMPFSTLRQIQKDADIIGNLRMEEIIDAAQHSQTNSRRSLIHRVLAGMEKELQVREAKEAAVSDEEPFETAEESDSTQELDEFVEPDDDFIIYDTEINMDHFRDPKDDHSERK